MRVVLTDGGRAAAGFRGGTGDCFTRAVAIASGRPYREIYDLVSIQALRERRAKKSSPRTGVYMATASRVMQALGWRWVPTMGIGTGCRVHLRAEELPAGSLVVRVSKHFTAVLDGVVHDNHDPSRDGARCVYGFWSL